MDERIKPLNPNLTRVKAWRKEPRLNPDASQQAMDSDTSSPHESADESLEQAEDQSYNYGYGM
jgi:hypothetical protein